MSTDLERLLQDAAGPPPEAVDLAQLEAAAGRRRLRRRAGGALAVLVVLGAVAVALPALVQPRVVIDTPADPGGWPVLVRYTETRFEEGRQHEWEVAARGWAEWTMLEGPGAQLDDTGAPAEEVALTFGEAFERDGEARWVGTPYHLDEDDREGPFDLVRELAAGRWSERFDADADPEAEGRWRPLDVFVADPGGPDEVPAGALFNEDVPEHRHDVADRLGLDPEALVAFTVERDDGSLVTWVRHAATGVPLFYEEAIPLPPDAEGRIPTEKPVRVEATEVRFDASLPEPEPPEPDPDTSAGDDAAGDPGGPEPAVAGAWGTIAEAPVPARQNPGAVWTGEELLVWGGVPRAAGAAYDPAEDSWRTLPEAPLAAREGHVAVWTGSELVVWGGIAYEEPVDPEAPLRGGPLGEPRADGAAYDPAADSWRPLAESPLDPRTDAAAVWTGSEVVVVGGFGADPESTVDFVDGAAYDPAADAWRAIPDLPELDEGRLSEVARDAVWTGEEMLVGGSRFAPGVAAAYDPEADAWRLIEDGPPAGGGAFVAWTGEEALLTDPMGSGTGSEAGRLHAYAVADDGWRELEVPPAGDGHALRFVAADDRLVAVGGRPEDGDAPMGAWLLDSSGAGWLPLGEPPLDGRGNPAAVWTGEEVLAWGGTAIAAGHEAAAHADGAAWRPDPAPSG